MNANGHELKPRRHGGHRVTALIARGYISAVSVPLWFVFLLAVTCIAADTDAPDVLRKLARSRTLAQTPKTYPAGTFKADGLRAVFYDGLPWHGKPTRVFAWYGLPGDASAKHKVPAMVLVHGGGGTAFVEWVRLWNSRGYAAIAMDNCGGTPSSDKGELQLGVFGKSTWPRHDFSGPAGWGGFDQIDAPMKDQWPYHAAADIVLAHSLIRSFPEVDADHVGITGVSWGGYLTCIAAGLDSRFKFAAPVYGCGFLGDNSAWLPEFKKLGKDKSEKWLHWFDPSQYLPTAKMPMLWVTGTNDFAYPMDSLQKSYRLPRGPRTLAIRVRMPHAHGGAGENPEEIRAFADSFCKRGAPLARVTKQGRDGKAVWVTFKSKSPIAKAELCFTRSNGKWQDRKWETLAAQLDGKRSRVTADLPDGTTVYYVNLIDDRGLVVSTEHKEMK